MVAELNPPAPQTSPRPLPLLSLPLDPLDLGLPPALPLPLSCPDLHICGSWKRIMEGTGKQTQALYAALLFLAGFVVLGTGSPACPVPSVGDSILGRPASYWDLDPTMMRANYRIGVVEVLKYPLFLHKFIIACLFFFPPRILVLFNWISWENMPHLEFCFRYRKNIWSWNKLGIFFCRTPDLVACEAYENPTSFWFYEV